MSAVDPARRAIVAERLLGSPVARRLRLALAPGDMVALDLPFDAANVTEGEMVHGGVIATLIDVAAVAGAVCAARAVPDAGATANLSIAFLAPALARDLRATPCVLRAGGRRHVVRVEVADADGNAVAEGLATVVLA